ncbi:LptE family protein [Fulvivirgaceae bacterium BMA10]|uniref:LptE family protein n=1 Tax=Splendidivirga corallicola TaxID=3051826 RepID=A0ABT8KX00_9BACT|nr:LptE family protein [Fulvivirgaceae bacterium BMA10]
MKLKNRWLSFFVPVLLLIPLTCFESCKFYSFTGVSIDYATTKTISVKFFENLSGDGPPTLSNTFTEGLRDFYQQNTQLSVLTDGDDADLQIEGEIVGYNFTPVAPRASGSDDISDQAALTRLTITVKVSYINTQNEEEDFNRSFSFYDDYETESDLSTEEDRLIETIFDQIVLDIFNATVANW